MRIEQNVIIKLQASDSNYFWGVSHSEKDGAQNYLVFHAMYRYFQKVAGVDNGEYTYFW